MTATSPLHTAHQIRTTEEWNRCVQVGAPVRYFPVRGSFEHRDTKTRTPAWVGGGAVLVSVEGVTGGVHIGHVILLPGSLVRSLLPPHLAAKLDNIDKMSTDELIDEVLDRNVLKGSPSDAEAKLAGDIVASKLPGQV